MKVFKNIRKNNGTSQILFSWDWHKKSTLHCNGFNSLGRTITFEFSFLQHSIPILLAFFSAKSANSTVFRIPILLVTEMFLCEAYRFRKTSQTSDAQKNTPIIFIQYLKIVQTKARLAVKSTLFWLISTAVVLQGAYPLKFCEREWFRYRLFSSSQPSLRSQNLLRIL